MNWTAVWSVASVVGAVFVWMGHGAARTETNEAPAAVQFGYLALVVGIFGLIAVYTSLAFAMLMFVVVSGVVWAADRWIGSKKRAEGAKPSDWVDLFAGLFPIILVVFLVRSFLVEPFTIPSSSMRPGLIPGDFILVNRFAYGIRVPVLNTVFIPTGALQRGDVVVFHYPPNPSVDYIKRVIGLPGDMVEYRDKQLTVNGKQMPQRSDGHVQYAEGGIQVYSPEQRVEQQGSVAHRILVQSEAPSVNPQGVDPAFPSRENCTYREDGSGFSCKVPEGQYFMMGDNRDNSADSRYWGFVPDKNVVGKAFLIWMNFGDWSRVGTGIH